VARLILHIGTHKTASTMIQNTLFKNRDLLATHGVIYPALGKHTGHHGLLMDWLALPAAYQLPKGGLGTLRTLAAEYVETDKTLFLSSEEFSRGGGTSGRVDMAELRTIFEGFDSVSVLCLLREQWQFLQSVYLEIARNRQPPRPPTLVQTALSTGMVDGPWCSYGSLYDQLLDGFSPNEIHFVDYAQASGHQGGILGVVLSFLELPFGSEALSAVKDGTSNVSPRALPKWASFAIAGGHTADPGLLDAIETAFDLEFGTDRKSCLFTRAEIKGLSDHFAPLNALLEKRVAETQPGFHISSTLPPPDAIYREDITAPFWLRAARRIYYRKSGFKQLLFQEQAG